MLRIRFERMEHMDIRNFFLQFFATLGFLYTNGQHTTGNWDTYVFLTNQKPVSVMVDLDFGASPASKEKRNAIVIQLALRQVLHDGMPSRSEIPILDSIENALADELNNSLGAQYTGRYTQEGKRSFYFYSNDTSDCRQRITTVFRRFSLYNWKLVISADNQLSYYKHILYPTAKEMERIKNRRMADALQAKGDKLTAPRKVVHYLFFNSETNRKKFAREVQDSGFVVENAGTEMGLKDHPFSLHISRTDKVDNESMDKVSLFLWERALHYFGKYDGWETFVVR